MANGQKNIHQYCWAPIVRQYLVFNSRNWCKFVLFRAKKLHKNGLFVKYLVFVEQQAENFINFTKQR